MRMEDGDLDPKKVQEKLNISKAEAVILVKEQALPGMEKQTSLRYQEQV
jgi:hypothetical protein